VLPIQIFVLVVCQAIVRGARTYQQIEGAVRAAFLPMYRFSSVSSPLCMIFAQTFLPLELWVPFFNAVAFCLGTTFNVIAKRKAMIRPDKKKE